jgi:hypothetical protein
MGPGPGWLETMHQYSVLMHTTEPQAHHTHHHHLVDAQPLGDAVRMVVVAAGQGRHCVCVLKLHLADAAPAHVRCSVHNGLTVKHLCPMLPHNADYKCV